MGQSEIMGGSMGRSGTMVHNVRVSGLVGQGGRVGG